MMARQVKSVFVSSLLTGKVLMVGLFPSIPCCAGLRDGAVFVRAVGAGLLLASDETQFNRCYSVAHINVFWKTIQRFLLFQLKVDLIKKLGKVLNQLLPKGLSATPHIGVESTLKKLLEFEPKMFAQHRGNAGHSLLWMCCFVHFIQ